MSVNVRETTRSDTETKVLILTGLAFDSASRNIVTQNFTLYAVHVKFFAREHIHRRYKK